SADGFMAHAGNAPRWITGEASRRHAHGVRGRMDAVLTGIGTVLADDPLLTCRLPGAENPQLVRVVADRNLRIAEDSQLVRTAKAQPTWVITGTEALQQGGHSDGLRAHGVTLLSVDDETLAPMTILERLAGRGLTRVLVEAGPALSMAFLQARCVDTLYWY